MDNVCIVLCSPRNPLNIGAAARAMSNFGFSRLRLVNAYDVAYMEAKSAVNASRVLEASEQFGSVAEAVADSSLVVGTASKGHRELRHPMRRLESGGAEIRSAAGGVALLFGSEKFGLSNDELTHCHWMMRIPTRDEHESMNLGQAVAVCLYELIRSDDAVKHQPASIAHARAEDVQRITERLTEALTLSGYLNESTALSSAAKVHRLVRRMHLNAKDAEIWLGILRQLLWKLGQ
jgi:TrmH family RNA methyltransferase